ncbi:conserved hypothetical protein [Aspergillus terreus NIH2624]|uniref:Hydrophobin n=2 Tax=Aspergillus terreus TaxID=33178 RepID=A0A5M3Z9G3_ASPTE|nr:uncharacterized protein ATEG_07808 [Aspergillus terreus NIH2624]EAU32070.1 conserved hypothetical protein [Aspergillus terreus NIH2624]KAG2420264.1 hypothetical protein HFD88_005065 [Aspergillus terreus]GES64936.1 hypothetical protein ATETN484_0011042600 [Aspergillus terreus]GFF19068.1 hydrophobin family protein [Aspergillus terreus]
MKFSTALSLLAAGAALVSAAPATSSEDEETYLVKAKCIKPFLCCGELKTPLDGVVDPILEALHLGPEAIVGSIGLACHAYDETCTTAPKCCSEANLLDGTVALGCNDLANPADAL